MAREAQRCGRKSGERIEREADHLRQRIFGFAREARLAAIGERHLPEPAPGDHAAHEARLFGHGEKHVERAPRHQTEIARVERDVDVGCAFQQPVEAGRRHLLERALACAVGADAINDIGTFARHRFQHGPEQFGRVLQIGIDDEDRLPATQVEPGGQRELVSVVARQVERDEVRVDAGELRHDRPATVARPVVDQDDLVIFADHCERGVGQPRMQRRQAIRLVVARHDDRELGRGHFSIR